MINLNNICDYNDDLLENPNKNIYTFNEKIMTCLSFLNFY